MLMKKSYLIACSVAKEAMVHTADEQKSLPQWMDVMHMVFDDKSVDKLSNGTIICCLICPYA